MPIQPIRETRDHVVSTIRQVAATQNADFRYLLNQARVESGLDPRAKAATSSATGLFQFTAGTWLDMVKRHGDKVGLAGEAQLLRSNALTPANRSQILDLRNEPQTATALAAHYAADNGRALAAAGHKAIGPTELYLAHFLGSGGATTFLNGLRDNPLAPAAKALPAAASANTGVFYRDHTPRSYQEIYNRFAEKFSVAQDAEVATPLGDGHRAPPNNGFPNFDSRLRQIVSSALSSQSSQPTSQSPEGPSALAVSEEAMTKYLKNFSFADHASGMAQISGATFRDASKGASGNGATSPIDEHSVSPLASGARMMLRAVDQELNDDGLKTAMR